MTDQVQDSNPRDGTLAVTNPPDTSNQGTAVSTVATDSTTSSCTKDPVLPGPSSTSQTSMESAPKIKHTCPDCQITFEYQTELTRHLLMVHKDKAGDLLQSFNNWDKEQKSQKERELLKVKEALRAKVKAYAEARKRKQEMAKAESEQRWKDLNITRAKVAAEAFAMAREQQRQIQIAKLEEEAAQNKNHARIAAIREKHRRIETAELAEEITQNKIILKARMNKHQKMTKLEEQEKTLDEAKEKQRQIEIAKLIEAAKYRTIASAPEQIVSNISTQIDFEKEAQEAPKNQNLARITEAMQKQQEMERAELGNQAAKNKVVTEARMKLKMAKKLEEQAKKKAFDEAREKQRQIAIAKLNEKAAAISAIAAKNEKQRHLEIAKKIQKSGIAVNGNYCQITTTGLNSFPLPKPAAIAISMQPSHETATVQSKTEPFKCRVCGATYDNIRYFKSHMLANHGEQLGTGCGTEEVNPPVVDAQKTSVDPLQRSTPKVPGQVVYLIGNFKSRMGVNRVDNLGTGCGINQDVGHPLQEATNSSSPPIHPATPIKRRRNNKYYARHQRKQITCKICGEAFYKPGNFKSHMCQGTNLINESDTHKNVGSISTSGSSRSDPTENPRRLRECCSVCDFEVQGTSWEDRWKTLESHVQINHFSALLKDGKPYQFVCKFCQNVAQSNLNLHGHISNCLSSQEIRNQVKKLRERNAIGLKDLAISTVTALLDPLDQFPVDPSSVDQVAGDSNFEEEVLLPQPMETFCAQEFQTVNCDICNMIFVNETDFRVHYGKEHDFKSVELTTPISVVSANANEESVDDGDRGYLQGVDSVKSESEDDSALGVIVPDQDAFMDEIDIETYVKIEEVEEKDFKSTLPNDYDSRHKNTAIRFNRENS